MKPFLPKKLVSVAFGFLLPCLMSLVVTCVAIMVSNGVLDPSFSVNWMGSWALGWPAAFAAVLFVEPFVRDIVTAIKIEKLGHAPGDLAPNN